MVEPIEEDPIGPLTLGPPINDEAFDFTQLGKNPLFKPASQLPIPTASAQETAQESTDLQKDISIFNVDKTNKTNAEINKNKLQNNTKLQIVPVENLQQALHVLGIKSNRAKNERFTKQNHSQT